MTWAKHGWASLAALVAFAVLTLVSGSWSEQSWVAVGVLAIVMSVLYWHYRRKTSRRDYVQKVVSVVPGLRDDRVIPPETKNTVALRDKGVCQIKGPTCIGGGTVWDHRVPYAWGGSSKDPDNIQQACAPCNNWKSDRFADTPSGRITYEEWKSAA
jgi:hypothetical protein